MTDEITPKEETTVEAPNEPISEPVQVPEAQTDQIPVFEPLPTPTEIETEPVAETIQTETKSMETEILPETISEPEVKPEISKTKPEPKQETKTEPEQPKIIPVIISSKSLARELLVKARNMIQFRKRKKLDKIMTLFLKKQKIINDEVEKFMHVSDATATRYLSQLEKEGKIKQTGKTGKSVFYSKI
jgi:predicted HTH transcriptional regulator